MIYRLPELPDEPLLAAYVKEHRDHGERSISASVGLTGSAYADWVAKIHRCAEAGDEAWGRSLLYLCLDEGRLIGLLSIRYELPAELSLRLGDVGYGVRPTERRKGYASRMLAHALDVCRQRGMPRVLLGCYADNLASAGVIRHCGGVLVEETDRYEAGRLSHYYRIDL